MRDNTITPLETGVDDLVPTPGRFAFEAIYPNPAVSQATLAFEVAEPSQVTLTVYDVLGRVVATLLSGPQRIGKHTVVWDGTDQAGRPVAGGLYLARITASGPTQSYTKAQQVIMLK